MGREKSESEGKMSLVEIRLSRADRLYHPGELVSGVIAIQSKGTMSHNGISIQLEGEVTLQLSAKSVGVFEAFYNSIKPIKLIDYRIDIQKSGKLPDGLSELPFEFELKPLPEQELYETYHGVFVSIEYTLTVDIVRGILAKNIQKRMEFIVEMATPNSPNIHAVEFVVTPEDLSNVRANAVTKIPRFTIKGKLRSAYCDIGKPFTGEPTEIQNIQICDGDVCRGLTIPIYMIFPRLFTCPTVAAKTFKIQFEVNLVVMFQ